MYVALLDFRQDQCEKDECGKGLNMMRDNIDQLKMDKITKIGHIVSL